MQKLKAERLKSLGGTSPARSTKYNHVGCRCSISCGFFDIMANVLLLGDVAMQAERVVSAKIELNREK